MSFIQSNSALRFCAAMVTVPYCGKPPCHFSNMNIRTHDNSEAYRMRIRPAVLAQILLSCHSEEGKMRISTVIIDDSSIFTQGVMRFLSEHPSIEVVGTAPSG